MSLTCDLEVANIVRTRVAERMRQLPLYTDSTTDNRLTSGQEQYATCSHRPLKSGMDRMGEIMVVKNITWPHDVVYPSTGKPATYKDSSVPAIVHGYLIVMATVDTKLGISCPAHRRTDIRL